MAEIFVAEITLQQRISTPWGRSGMTEWLPQQNKRRKRYWRRYQRRRCRIWSCHLPPLLLGNTTTQRKTTTNKRKNVLGKKGTQGCVGFCVCEFGFFFLFTRLILFLFKGSSVAQVLCINVMMYLGFGFWIITSSFITYRHWKIPYNWAPSNACCTLFFNDPCWFVRKEATPCLEKCIPTVCEFT